MHFIHSLAAIGLTCDGRKTSLMLIRSNLCANNSLRVTMEYSELVFFRRNNTRYMTLRVTMEYSEPALSRRNDFRIASTFRLSDTSEKTAPPKTGLNAAGRPAIADIADLSVKLPSSVIAREVATADRAQGTTIKSPSVHARLRRHF
jgi:hypothetical protein